MVKRKRQIEKINSTVVGVAGEHYVMCQLLRRGWIAALAPTGVPNMDIIVTDKDSRRLCSLAVKTRRDIGSDKGWHMKSKHEKILADDLFYCFVDFGKAIDESVRCFVVPSAVVCDVLSASHTAWSGQPGKKGQKVNKDTQLRRLLPDYSRLLTPALRERLPDVYERIAHSYPEGWLGHYENRWDKLGLPIIVSF